MRTFLTLKELVKLGFKSVGKNVNISKNTIIRNAQNISIGNDVRIDDFCIISAGIENEIKFENNIHIAAGCYLFGGGGIEIKKGVGISSGCKVYSLTDNYNGDYLTGPTFDLKYRNIIYGKVVLNQHVIIGTNSVILPNVNIGEGAAIGAMSLVNKNCQPWKIYVGSPVREVRERKKGLLSIL